MMLPPPQRSLAVVSSSSFRYESEPAKESALLMNWLRPSVEPSSA